MYITVRYFETNFDVIFEFFWNPWTPQQSVRHTHTEIHLTLFLIWLLTITTVVHSITLNLRFLKFSYLPMGYVRTYCFKLLSVSLFELRNRNKSCLTCTYTNTYHTYVYLNDAWCFIFPINVVMWKLISWAERALWR